MFIDSAEMKIFTIAIRFKWRHSVWSPVRSSTKGIGNKLHTNMVVFYLKSHQRPMLINHVLDKCRLSAGTCAVLQMRFIVGLNLYKHLIVSQRKEHEKYHHNITTVTSSLT